jgi:hypothetical protein
MPVLVYVELPLSVPKRMEKVANQRISSVFCFLYKTPKEFPIPDASVGIFFK